MATGRAPPHLHPRVEYPVCVAEDEGRGHTQPFQPRGEGGPRVHAPARVGAAGLREALPLGRPHGPQQAAQGPLACRWLHGDLERRRWGGSRSGGGGWGEGQGVGWGWVWEGGGGRGRDSEPAGGRKCGCSTAHSRTALRARPSGCCSLLPTAACPPVPAWKRYSHCTITHSPGRGTRPRPHSPPRPPCPRPCAAAPASEREREGRGAAGQASITPCAAAPAAPAATATATATIAVPVGCRLLLVHVSHRFKRLARRAECLQARACPPIALPVSGKRVSSTCAYRSVRLVFAVRAHGAHHHLHAPRPPQETGEDGQPSRRTHRRTHACGERVRLERERLPSEQGSGPCLRATAIP